MQAATEAECTTVSAKGFNCSWANATTDDVGGCSSAAFAAMNATEVREERRAVCLRTASRCVFMLLSPAYPHYSASTHARARSPT
jgi:hypothetical protein